MAKFRLHSDYKPTGDQPGAIKQLTAGLQDGLHHQTLLGVTGSGKSLVSETPVYLRINGVEQMTQIGQFIDEKFIKFEEYIRAIIDTSQGFRYAAIYFSLTILMKFISI